MRPEVPMTEPERVSDAAINEAIRCSGAIPELFEWSDGAYRSVVLRLETSIGHYAEARIEPGWTVERVGEAIDRLIRDLEEEQ
jgi:hypothetical protein